MGATDRRLTAIRVLAHLHRILESADAGLTIPQYRLLAVLSEGGERSARVAQKLAVRKPTLTALADGLIAAGYAERESEPGDRRIVRLVLTDAGRAALTRADEAYLARLTPLLDGLSDPDRLVRELIEVGEVLTARRQSRMAAESAGPPGPVELRISAEPRP
jgi:DNA-binding MarR family transcriptional regulator